ncbi:hypothetical protein C169_20469 [Paenibacillus sp. FSL R5-808]|nr:hypothetical protein C169_20469 [Paenibacillus sp. FSL R5-808]
MPLFLQLVIMQPSSVREQPEPKIKMPPPVPPPSRMIPTPMVIDTPVKLPFVNVEK